MTDPNKKTETLNVFIEDGHANCAEAIEHIREHKTEVEPIPRSFTVDDSGLLPRFENHDPNDPYRERGLKIGAYEVGSKAISPPLQAADLLVYSAHAGAAGSKADEYTKKIWMNIAERVPPYVMPLSKNFLSLLAEDAEQFAEKNKEKRRMTAQFIKNANRFGLRAEVVPHKGIDLCGKRKDIMHFLNWSSKNARHG